MSQKSKGSKSVEKAGAKDAKVAATPSPAPTPAPSSSKKQAFITRTIFTLVMLAGFLAILAAGHVYIIALVMLIQVLTFKEVIKLASEPAREKNLPWGRSINWYFLATTIYFLEGESLIYYFKHVALVDTYLLPLAIHHRFLSYCLYIIGFVFFVYSLEKSYYRFQFTQFCITHMTLLLVVVQAHFIVNNIFSGIFWFVLPAALVISNDIFAYLCGITFGRTPLLALSPKKTVEGFVGAWIFTIISGVLLTSVLYRYKYFICPIQEIGSNAFSGLDCNPNPAFLPRAYPVPTALQGVLSRTSITFPPIYLHAICLGTFASLIAPFGGFFASGLKRAYQVKDFGNMIPGHGGITDRMDCQFLMGFFSYLYYESFVSTHQLSVGTVLQTAITSLSAEDQLELVRALLRSLEHRGIGADDKLVQCLSAAH